MPDRATGPEDLGALLAEIRRCAICRENPAGKPFAHQPRPVVVASSQARILVAGQAPGTRVHASGRPFDDPSGDRLRTWLGTDKATFYDQRRFAIVPMGFCFPGLDGNGSDLPPRKECAPLWRSRLMAALPQVDLVLAIGRYAQAWHLGPGCRQSLTETVMDWRRVMEESAKPLAIPLPHPSWRNSGWLKRNPWFEAELLPVLRAEVARRL